MVLLPIILHGTTALKTSVVFPFSLLFFKTRKCSSNSTCSKPLIILLAASETLHSLLSSSCPCRKGRTSTKYSKCWWTMYFHKVGWNGVFFHGLIRLTLLVGTENGAETCMCLSSLRERCHFRALNVWFRVSHSVCWSHIFPPHVLSFVVSCMENLFAIFPPRSSGSPNLSAFLSRHVF